MRLIDADALMQTLGITDMDCVRCAWYSKAYRRCKRGGDFEDACCAIEDAPTIEAVPVVHGRWIDNDIDPEAWNFCSVCGEQAIDLFDYCPNCGAHMGGEQGDND